MLTLKYGYVGLMALNSFVVIYSNIYAVFSLMSNVLLLAH